jgi:hypothetical protein
MTDIRKVVTPLNHPTMAATSNYCKSLEGDRPVYYSAAGLLETEAPPVLGTARVVVVANAAAAAAASNASFLEGSYLSTTARLQPSDLDLSRKLIRCSSGPANSVMTLPDPGGPLGLIPYLKKKYGPDKISPGLYKEYIIMNDNVVFNVTIRATTPGAGNGTIITQGMDETGAPNFDVLLPGTTGFRNSFTLGLYVDNITPGAEAIIWYAY